MPLLDSSWARGVAVVGVGLGLGGMSCSKDIAVQQTAVLDVGEQCSGPTDRGCGEGAVCVAGFCRLGCTVDAECPQGAICIGDREPFGCALPAELACSSSQPCSPPLTCGIDGKCRSACNQDADCPRNEHDCIAGTCVGDGERGSETWRSCTTGSESCQGAELWACNVVAPGVAKLKSCVSEAACSAEVGGQAGGCEDRCAGVVCSSPPPSECVDAGTLRTYAPAGTCAEGACSYAPTDTLCPSGTCSGVACTVTGSATSCATSGPGLTDCGLAGNEDCCTSLVVTGGTFYRSYDGLTYTDDSHPATVSDFGLDKYEVTVGRFRKFKAAWDGGWRPASGAGKHTHLNGGAGLTVPGGGSYESGWDTTWASSVAVTDANLQCEPTLQTWTTTAGSNEKRPINCANWYELAAFCIWDGGFLPSEAEWNYAASGGSEQRAYPWSVPANSTSIGCTQASYDCNNNSCGDGVSGCAMTDLIEAGTKPAGNGRWGQAELGGNVYEFVMDWYVNGYPSGACNNCANTTASSSRAVRGGYFYLYDSASILLASYRVNVSQAHRTFGLGGRCARSAP